MVEIPYSPLACAVVTTLMLIVTFYLGRYIGIKKIVVLIEKEMKKYEQEK
jgi:hypothetical protein